ncbi:hypothetical protein [Prauserella flavalba]|uniref:PPE family domain-containing protein n=1 Tax=Prauserella flavalba TaxID=1477506 RepID=A0A318LJU9_9PSEU|nr:hypothetical protein [Prauserella flavalba]PXY23965.1 hypothetical protein BA062_27230 [Prauserella flavalba]
MEYGNLPGMVQFAVADVEAHAHLPRVERASRMWRAVADELRQLSDALHHELDCLRPQWKDTTGAGFLREATRLKAEVDELLTRITEHRPWQALDDLARQLLLTRARVTDSVERATDASHDDAAAHLTELDRYFHAAAEAVLLAASGGSSPAADCCSGEGAPVLAGGPALASAPVPGGGAALPPGSVSIPGLVAVPPGAGYGSARLPARGSRSPGGRSLDPSDIAGGSLGDGGARPAGSLPDTGGPDTPSRIEQAANPVPMTEDRGTPQPPQPPESPRGAGSGAQGAAGRMVPPMMMMPPMMPGAGRSTTGRRSARSLEDGERRTRTPQATPGVPPRLRGRSALGDPAAIGFRPVAMSGRTTAKPEPSVAEALDHEVWQVANPGAASPLKPEVAEEPKRVRRPRL